MVKWITDINKKYKTKIDAKTLPDNEAKINR